MVINPILSRSAFHKQCCNDRKEDTDESTVYHGISLLPACDLLYTGQSEDSHGYRDDENSDYEEPDEKSLDEAALGFGFVHAPGSCAYLLNFFRPSILFT